MSGIYLLNTLSSFGAKTTLLSGYLQDEVQAKLSQDVRVGVDETLDPYIVKDDKKLSKAYLELLNSPESNHSKILLNIDFRYRKSLSEDVARLSHQKNIIIQIHDPIEHFEEFSSLSSNTVVLPTTEYLKNRLNSINGNLKYVILPPFFDSDILDTLPSKENVRKDLGISDNTIVFVQPTRIDTNKGICKAVDLIAKVKAKGDKPVLLVITGGYSNPRSNEAKEEITRQSELLQVPVMFLGGTSKYQETIKAADLITYFSLEEGWGMSPAEAAYLGKPVATSRYTNKFGDPIFDEVYGDFEFIEDGNSQYVNNDTLNKVFEICKDPPSLEHTVYLNKKRSLRYASKTMLPKLSEIFGGN